MLDTVRGFFERAAINVDVLSMQSGFSPYKVVDSFLAFDNALVRQRERLVYNYANRSNFEKGYLSVFSSEKDVCFSCDPILFFHGGSFVHATRLFVQYHFLALSEVSGMPLVSVDYPVANQPDVTLASVRKRIDQAVAFTRELFPGRRIFVAGTSSGGTLAIDLVRRHPPTSFAGLIVDSPPLCLDKLKYYYSTTDRSCVKAGERALDSPDWIVNKYSRKGLCFESYVPPVPTLILIPGDGDLIVPIESFYPWAPEGSDAGKNGSIRYCRDRYGVHAFSLSYFGGCIDSVESWFRDVDPSSSVTAAKIKDAIAVFQVRQAAAYAFDTVLWNLNMKDILCRNYCVYGWDDPYSEYLRACNGDEEENAKKFAQLTRSAER